MRSFTESRQNDNPSKMSDEDDWYGESDSENIAPKAIKVNQRNF